MQFFFPLFSSEKDAEPQNLSIVVALGDCEQSASGKSDTGTTLMSSTTVVLGLVTDFHRCATLDHHSEANY
jgi:hypothetical protein